MCQTYWSRDGPSSRYGYGRRAHQVKLTRANHHQTRVHGSAWKCLEVPEYTKRLDKLLRALDSEQYSESNMVFGNCFQDFDVVLFIVNA